MRPQELACAPYTAGYLSVRIYAVGLYPNSRTAGYLGVCIYKNPAIVCLAIAGYCDVRRTNLVGICTLYSECVYSLYVYTIFIRT